LLKHGGGIQQAALKFGRPYRQWLDLSTGINPLGWRVPKIPPARWLRLPEDGDGLEASAASYYGADNFLAVAGSQAAIQVLSRLTNGFRVAVLSPTYSEHAHAWGLVGKKPEGDFYSSPPRHQVELVSLKLLDKTIEQYDVVIVVNPNNPTGRLLSKKRLLGWWKRLMVSSHILGREKWLIVDEAFMDSSPEGSLITKTGEPGLIVLRSLGKFFGLAGARVGFVFGWPALLKSLHRLLGPWQITGPSRWVAREVLLDKEWQSDARRQLLMQRDRLADLLSGHGLTPAGGTSLFQWVPVVKSKKVRRMFAEQGILVRHFTKPGGIRFGLPGADSEWRRLEKTLLKIQSHVQRKSPPDKHV
jgi:cobalamin biosynthesis protein CobC